MTRAPFPLVWDNTMRSAFVACPRKFWWQFGLHNKPMRESIDLHAGGAWAKALEVARYSYYVSHLSSDESQARGVEALVRAYGSFECPPDNPKSLQRLCEAFVYYFQNFPLETDHAQPYIGPNGPMIEFSFATPLYDEAAAEGREEPPLLHPESGEPIIYAGRADMVATYAGAVTIYDDKTTKAIGASWADQWNMRAQFTGYVWAANEMGIPATQVLVRGIGILKTKFTHAEAPAFREPFRVARWHNQVVRDIRRAMKCWEEGFWDTNESDSCSSYSGCMFQQPCMAADPEPWLEANYTKRVWDPVHRAETPAEGRSGDPEPAIPL